jgi:hypothetical protein
MPNHLVCDACLKNREEKTCTHGQPLDGRPMRCVECGRETSPLHCLGRMTTEETARKFEAAAESEDPRSALQRTIRPMYDEHQGHTRLVAGCIFCEGVLT